MKKPLLDKQVPHEEKKVEYIECLDEKAIKVIGKEEEKEGPLVIPLLKSKTWHDRIINKINADIFTQKTRNKNDVSNIQQAVSNIQIKISSNKNESILDEQAAKEIIEDLKSIDEKDKLSDITLPLMKGQNLNGAEESILEDYENVPVESFGTAMLRGMGWKSGEGIGKNPKLVATVVHEVRPAGMGLGADKIALQKQSGKVKKEEEELKIEKGSFIKIIAGKRSNTYGQIEGFDDAGRLIIKMALNGNTISVNECIVQAVTKAEYLKNSKVLNAAKYEEHKIKEDTNKQKSLDYFNSNDNSGSDIFERKRKPHFAKYAESIPDGETSTILSEAARKNNVYVIAGTIPERNNDKLYNTCTVWAPDGKLVAKHRKMHLFDIDIKGKITFRESDSLSPGNTLTTFEAKGCKIGIGICYDIRFEEMARLYRNKACVSPARGPPPGYVAWGHTQLTNPWGEILDELDADEAMVVSDIDLKVVDEVRAQIPTFNQRRTDLYDTIWKGED
ncbi:nitrilase 1-like protein [Lasius niger]|uniref:omega-amidase n=1 Tax=Lasius niger TaxID=67767 RepID=A0A0J7NXE1_LASNI|nr:nitrilase 1-like protein [Lasius niger]